jgi:hypothetical protein
MEQEQFAAREQAMITEYQGLGVDDDVFLDEGW